MINGFLGSHWEELQKLQSYKSYKVRLARTSWDLLESSESLREARMSKDPSESKRKCEVQPKSNGNQNELQPKSSQIESNPIKILVDESQKPKQAKSSRNQAEIQLNPKRSQPNPSQPSQPKPRAPAQPKPRGEVVNSLDSAAPHQGAFRGAL